MNRVTDVSHYFSQLYNTFTQLKVWVLFDSNDGYHFRFNLHIDVPCSVLCRYVWLTNKTVMCKFE